jgi:hypothetical protein
MLETPIGDWRSRGKRRFQLDSARSICRGRRLSAWAGGGLGVGRPAVLIWPFFLHGDFFHEVMRVRGGGGAYKERREERFLSAQADAFAGANAEEKVGLLRSK